MNPRVREVVPEPGYRLRLTFTNGEVRVYDMKSWLNKGVFRELRDEAAFKSVHPWHGTVQWSGGQDVCPDALYEDSISVEARPEQVRKVAEQRATYKAGRKHA